MPSDLSRRAFLQAGAVVAASGATGYLGARLVSKSGIVVARHVTGGIHENGTVVDTIDIVHTELNSDETVDRTVHPDYRNLLVSEGQVTVSTTAHYALNEQFDEVRYYLQHQCPNAECSAPAVSYRALTNTRLGETAYIIYRGDDATVVPA